MSTEDLSLEWENFRYKVFMIERRFIEQNRNEYHNFSDFERDLNRELSKMLGKEKERLLKKQKLLRIFQK